MENQLFDKINNLELNKYFIGNNFRDYFSKKEIEEFENKWFLIYNFFEKVKILDKKVLILQNKNIDSNYIDKLINFKNAVQNKSFFENKNQDRKFAIKEIKEEINWYFDKFLKDELNNELASKIILDFILDNQFDNFKDKYDNSLSILENKKISLISEIELESVRYKDLTKKISELGSSEVTSRYKHIFYNFKEELGKSSMIWLFAMLLLVTGILFLGFNELDSKKYINLINILKPETSETSEASETSEISLNSILILYLAKRIVIFSVLFYALYFCSNNYRLNKHNELLNIHKAHALETFEIFVSNASTSPDIRNQILNNVSNLIYSEPNTGYISEANSKGQNSKIIELLMQLVNKNVTN